jgi:hypothetical protein
MRELNRFERAQQRANLRQKAQELAAQGCPRCRGSKIQVAEPAGYQTGYEASCVDCGEMWWTEWWAAL